MKYNTVIPYIEDSRYWLLIYSETFKPFQKRSEWKHIFYVVSIFLYKNYFTENMWFWILKESEDKELMRICPLHNYPWNDKYNVIEFEWTFKELIILVKEKVESMNNWFEQSRDS